MADRRRRLSVLLAAIVLAACGTTSGTASPAASGVAPSVAASIGSAASQTPADPVWTKALDDLGPDGSRSLDSAVRLFALAFGPIPGVDAQRPSTVLRDATVALRAVKDHWTELTPDQQAAITKAIAPAPDAFHFTVQHAPSAGLAPGQAPVVLTSFVRRSTDGAAEAIAADTQQLVDAANGYRAAFAQKLKADIPAEIQVFVQDPSPTDASLGSADPAWDGGTYKTCTIVLTPGTSVREAFIALAQAVFQCMAASSYTEASWPKAPSWIIDGAAEWAGDQVSDIGQGVVDLAWNDYMDNAAVPLFEHSFDALGFYAHLNETGTSPWTVMPRMFQDGQDNAKAYDDAGGGGVVFLSTWASSMAREVLRGPAWNATDISITSAAIDIEDTDVAEGAVADVAVPAYTNAVTSLAISAVFVTVDLPGATRLADSHGDRVGVTGATFCVDTDKCSKPCPDGTVIKVTEPLDADALVAVTGGPAGVSGRLAGLSHDEECKREQKHDVEVHFDREASPGVQAGRIVDLVACDGPYGTWTGVLRLGGLDDGQGFVVPFVDFPVTFTVGGSGTRTVETTTGGVVTTPIGSVPLDYTLTVTVDEKTMTIVPDPSIEGARFDDMPIGPAQAGRCP